MLFLLSAFFFSKSTFSKNSIRNTIRTSNSLDPSQARHIVGPDLGSNCLQRLSAVNTCRQRVNYWSVALQMRHNFSFLNF